VVGDTPGWHAPHHLNYRKRLTRLTVVVVVNLTRTVTGPRRITRVLRTVDMVLNLLSSTRAREEGVPRGLRYDEGASSMHNTAFGRPA